MRRGLIAAAIGVVIAGQVPLTMASPSALATQGRVTIVQTRDPALHARGILSTYWWDSRFGRKYESMVRLYQDRRLVGQISFMRGWTRAPAFFRTTATSQRHSFEAVGVLLRSNGTVVTGSTERSVHTHWRVVVQRGQVVPRR